MKKRKIYEEPDPERRARSEPSVCKLSHGLIFHQCAILISLTEEILHLKGYDMKGKYLFFLLLVAATRHRPHPPTPHSIFLSLSFSPTRPAFLLFCFETPKSNPAAPQKPSPCWLQPQPDAFHYTLKASTRR